MHNQIEYYQAWLASSGQRGVQTRLAKQYGVSRQAIHSTIKLAEAELRAAGKDVKIMPKERFSEKVSGKVAAGVTAWLADYCKRHGDISQAEVLRLALAEFMERHEGEQFLAAKRKQPN